MNTNEQNMIQNTQSVPELLRRLAQALEGQQVQESRRRGRPRKQNPITPEQVRAAIRLSAVSDETILLESSNRAKAKELLAAAKERLAQRAKEAFEGNVKHVMVANKIYTPCKRTRYGKDEYYLYPTTLTGAA